MRIVLWVDPNAVRAHVDALVEEARRLRGVKAVEVEADMPAPPADHLPSPDDLELEERSRFRLVNVVLGEAVATVARPDGVQTASMALTLLLCRGVFVGTETFYAALCANAPQAWEGKRGSIRRLYTGLKRRLDDTMYPLAGEGFYGFLARMEPEQRRVMFDKMQRRVDKGRATAAARRRHPLIDGSGDDMPET